ncbi:MAG: single-stranded DNA-binding protein [Promethearchaeota archaeon]
MSEENETNKGIELKIRQLEPLNRNINVTFKVIEKGERRDVTSRNTGEEHTVCDTLVADESGAIILSLWDDDIELCQENNIYELANGYVNVYRGSLRLSRGKNGTISESSDTIDEVNLDNNRSDEVHEMPRRHRSYRQDRGRGGYDRDRGRGGYGRDRGRGGYDRDRGRSRY